MNLKFYYDVVCPYAYLASLRVEALAERTGAILEWCPVLLGGLYRNHQTADVPANDWAAPKVAVGAADLIREAQANGAPFNHNHRHPLWRMCLELRFDSHFHGNRCLWQHGGCPTGHFHPGY